MTEAVTEIKEPRVRRTANGRAIEALQIDKLQFDELDSLIEKILSDRSSAGAALLGRLKAHAE